MYVDKVVAEAYDLYISGQCTLIFRNPFAHSNSVMRHENDGWYSSDI